MSNLIPFPRRGRRWTRRRDYGGTGDPPVGPGGPRPRSSGWLRFAPLWLAALAGGAAYGSGWLPNSPEGQQFGLCHTGGGTNCVVDGDTIWLAGEKIRIVGIDAPETHPPRCAREAELGEAATKRLRELLNSGAVTTSSIDRDEDSYGRKLRNVRVDGFDVGDALVAEGLARPYGTGRRSWC